MDKLVLQVMIILISSRTTPRPMTTDAAATAAPSPKLDPMGAIIYYLCVTEAIKQGSLEVPSSQKISSMLDVADNGTPVHAHVDRLWRDLQWMDQEKLLFHEQQADDSKYRDSFAPRSLAAHNVNRRIEHFHPGFVHDTPRHRRIVQTELLDQTISAVRLVALKALYYFQQWQVPQKLLLEFLQGQGLIPDDVNEYYRFITVMNRIGYIDFPDLSPGERFSDAYRNKHLLVSPAPLFRNQDMYVELRALDYFSEQRSKPDSSRARRLDLRNAAEGFAEVRRKRKTSRLKPRP
jgi:hypothetical protein